MNTTRTNSDLGIAEEQLNCFGIGKLKKCFIGLCLAGKNNFVADFPDTCPRFYGIQTMDCLKTVWEMVGCLPDGHEFPEKLKSHQISVLSWTNYSWDKPLNKHIYFF